MSTKVVIIALVVALVLGIGAYVALQPAPKPVAKAEVFSTGDLVVPMEVAQVASIEIESPDGTVEKITRGDRGVYSLVVNRQSSPGPSWPLEDGRVTSLLRVLSAAVSLDAPDEKAAMDDGASRVTIRQDGGKTIHMLLSERTLTGRGLVKVVEGTTGDAVNLRTLRDMPGKLALVGDHIHQAFRNPGPRAWRDTSVMRGIGPEVSRIRMKNNDLSTKLARLEGKWMVQSPIAAPADPARISRLISTLSGLRIVGFNDDPGAKTPGSDITGLNNPLAEIVGETDRRVLSTDAAKPDEVTIRTETTELVIGNPADGTAQTRYASIGRNGPVVVISGAGLVRELFDAVEYVSRRAVQTPAMDIGMIVLEPATPVVAAATPPAAVTDAAPGTTPTAAPTATGSPTPSNPPAGATPAVPLTPPSRIYRRDLDTWKEVTGSSEVSLDEAKRKSMADLLKFITTDEAASVAFQAPAIWNEQGQFIVGSLAGTPLETVTIGATDGANLGIRTAGADGNGAVYRWFPREKVPPMLIGFLPRPTESVTVPPEQIQKEIMK